MRTPLRSLALLTAAVLVVGACSGSDDDTVADDTVADDAVESDGAAVDDATTSDDVVAGAEADDETVAQADDGVDDAVTAGAGELLYGVAVDIAAPDRGVAERIAVDVAADATDDLDPFGRFASCSGVRDAIGVYSLVVADPEAGAFGLLTDVPITGPGIFDADVRVEPAGREAFDAAGTVTLDDGLASGSFVAFSAEGGQVEGEFECASDASPVPLSSAADRGDAVTVEVFALLRRDGAERVVGSAVQSGGSAEATCPAADGSDSGTLVRIDGGVEVGAISAFELTDGSSPALRLRAGGTELQVSDVELTRVGDDAAATFSGVAEDGTTVDGAFRCG